MFGSKLLPPASTQNFRYKESHLFVEKQKLYRGQIQIYFLKLVGQFEAVLQMLHFI